MLQSHWFHARLALTALGVSVTLLAASCGSDAASANQQVASLGTLAADTATTAAASTADTQDALLAYAACMRENGIEMADPTFDADGNATGGLFGPESGIDPQADGFQEAQDACGSLIEGIQLGGNRQGGGFDADAVQAALTDFTKCLRDQGLDVDDIEFGGGQGPGAGGGGFGGGTPPAGATGDATGNGATPADGSMPAGGFQGGTPPDGGQGGPGGEGFDPTSRIIDQLGLDADDPATATAIAACQSLLDSAFQTSGNTDGASATTDAATGSTGAADATTDTTAG